MLFFRKKKKNSPTKPEDNINFFFKIAGLVFIVYVVVNSYFGEHKTANINKDLAEIIPENSKDNKLSDKSLGVDADKNCISEVELQAKAMEAFNQLKENPEFKNISNFVQHVESEVDKKQPDILEIKDGFLLFVPYQVAADEGKKDIKINHKLVKFNLTKEVLDKKSLDEIARVKIVEVGPESLATTSKIEGSEKEKMLEKNNEIDSKGNKNESGQSEKILDSEKK